jgi:hypothetical protein
MIKKHHHQLTNLNSRWIALNNDIDPDLIELLNTVVVDKKVHMFASHQLILLITHTRFIFEISHFKKVLHQLRFQKQIFYAAMKRMFD